MPPNTKSTEAEAQQRHEAVKMFRAGHSAPAIATALHRSRRWVYDWVAYQRQHPHTRFRSASRASYRHPNRISRQTTYRIVQLRQTLARQRNARLRYAPVGARTIRRELEKRHVKPCPSLSTIQRILQRRGSTTKPLAPSGRRTMSSVQPKVFWAKATMSLYAPSAQIFLRRHQRL